MKSIKIAICLLLVFSLTDAEAQRKDHRGDRGQMLEQLDLTEAQKARIAQLREEHRAAMEKTRSATFSEDSDRRSAVREMRKQHREAISAVLTDEQRAKAKSLREAHRTAARERMEARRNDPEAKARRAEMRKYKEERVEPVLRAQRKKLRVAASDEAELERLRAVFAQRKAERKERSKERTEGRGIRPAPRDRQQTRANMESLRKLVEKYSPQIKTLMAEIQPQREQWRKALREMAGDAPVREGRRGGERGDKLRKGMGAARFLLMETD